jgi:hypothetical protein
LRRRAGERSIGGHHLIGQELDRHKRLLWCGRL